MCTYIVMLGTAGSGKSTLTKAYSSWLKELGYNVKVINLDPGVKKLLYEPDFDIRTLFTIEDIMVKYGLGPNGAFIKSSYLMLENMDKILSVISKYTEVSDYIIIDTPGQMEIFVYRESGPKIIRKLQELRPTLCIYIIDGELLSNVIDLVTSWFHAILVQLRLNTPTIPVINKIDKVIDYEIIRKFEENPSIIKNMIKYVKHGVITDVAHNLIDIIIQSLQATRLVKVNSLTGEGLEDLHSIVHEAFCTCGDLT